MRSQRVCSPVSMSSIMGLGNVGVDAADPAEVVPEALVLDDLGDPVLDEPGFVGVAQVVEVHAGLDRRLSARSRIVFAGQGGDLDPAAEVRPPVQAAIGAGEHELGVGTAVA